ncbi:MAG: hypothetical protein ABW032_11535 [Burkholderiaceae bacterium]
MKPTPHRRCRTPAIAPRIAAAAISGAALLAGCGGGNPLANPPTVSNPAGAGGDKLAFAYFQKCVAPIFLEQLPIVQNGVASTNTCSGAGCHRSGSGTGGALSLVVPAQPVDLADPANTPDAIRLTDMYKNYYSAQGVTVPGSPIQSRLIDKPLLLSVLHGGGRVFADEDDPHVKRLSYWISHPAPTGQDEFSPATYSMFTPADPATGTCNTQ